jgi:outer membrane protein assembly factor BamB
MIQSNIKPTVMRKIILILVLLFASLDHYGQYSVSSGNSINQGSTLRQNKKVIGKNFLTNEDIYADEYVFSKSIYDFYIDSTSKFMTLQLRKVSRNGKRWKNKGEILVYDLDQKKVKWRKDINYQTSSVLQYGHTIIYTHGNKSYCLDFENGKELWELKNTLYFIDASRNIGIGYGNKTFDEYTNILEGIDLENGRIIWKKELNREYSWNDVFYLNDSSLVIVAAGLHRLNLKTGRGWDYHAITGEKDYSVTAAANTAGVALGLLTGTFVISTGHDLVRDLASNAVVDSSDIYFASKEQLIRINKQTGEIIWHHPFPEGMASKSTLFLKDSLVFIVNRGSAMMGYRKLNYGTPFFAAFNQSTGKQNFFSLIQTDKDPILDFKMVQDQMLLLFKGRVFQYSLENGSQKFRKAFNTEEYGELKYFMGNQVYVKRNDRLFSPLKSMDTTNNYIFTDKGNTLVLDSNLIVVDKLDFEQLYVRHLATKDYAFITQEHQTLILDSLNQKIAEVKATTGANLIGKKLYDIQKDRFLEIHLDELLKEGN